MIATLDDDKKVYTITIAGERYEHTRRELHTMLTRAAYDLYFNVMRTRGTVVFGWGCLAPRVEDAD